VPSEVGVSTLLTKRIALNIPMLSSPMDTVTEHEMAIALAKEGGLGIIHKNMSVELQTEEVNKVKRSANGIILDPETLRPDQPVRRAQELMNEERQRFPNTDLAASCGIHTGAIWFLERQPAHPRGDDQGQPGDSEGDCEP
jgi:IMP dehydrogenase